MSASTLLCAACHSPLPSEGERAGVCVVCAFTLALYGARDDEPAVLDSLPEAGPTIGPYRLLRRLGEGGMGEVWQAEQTEPVRREVALKVVKAGMDTREVLARFDAERQALARMDHPCVSKVFDAGSTPEGRPYFVMEYVPGIAITEYCDRHALTTRERIELFLRVCDGVQHAHHKAIIHRDLKPSNVLVEIRDGVAAPKIIDFGVAKATVRPLTERSLYTGIGTLIGTPEYMSPEQADPMALDVDTRTDVYALGVMLYELLVGALPFEPEALREAGFAGLLRTIREVQPRRPSTRLGTLAKERRDDCARRRRADAGSLRRQLKGELDWITMKAIEKERERRYGSPAELAADLTRYLRYEPVLAGPPSAAYQARKFVRRHRVSVGAAALGVLAIAGFGVAMAAQAKRIARESAAKQRVAQFLTELFEVSSPSEARGKSITARELLDRGVDRIRKDLADEPQVRAELMKTMGVVYRNLGLYGQAGPLLREALEAQTSLHGPDAPETLRVASELGRSYFLQDRDGEAEPLLLRTLEAQKRVFGPEHPDTLTTMNHLGYVYWGQLAFDKAETLFRTALEARRRVLGPEHPDTLRSMQGLGATLDALGRYDEAERVLGETLEIRRRLLGEDDPATLNSKIKLSLVYMSQGRLTEALDRTREVLEGYERVLGPSHPDTLGTYANAASLSAALGNPSESMRYLRRAVDLGFAYPDWIAEDDAFRPFHGNPEFERIVAAARENEKRAKEAK